MRPAGTLPGQRTIAGTRMPPSRKVPFPALSGQLYEYRSPPLSLVNTTKVSRSSPASCKARRRRPTPSSSRCIMAVKTPSEPRSAYPRTKLVVAVSATRRSVRLAAVSVGPSHGQ